jgi:epoxyqueuosine reductase
VLPSARSVISLGTIYNTGHPYTADSLDADRAAIARYAWGDDYHDVIQARLDVLLQRLRSTCGEELEARAYVDTGPVQERVYAQYAGLGWIGKNTCLINPELGSWIFLSEIICNLDLEPDEPIFDRCGTCTLCLAACPTGALVEPGVLDSTRCLSYLTIENKGTILEEQRVLLGSHAYGCDICQDVCPYNNSATTAASADDAWQPRQGSLAADRRRAAGTAQRQRDEARRGSPAAKEPGGCDRQQRQSRGGRGPRTSRPAVVPGPAGRGTRCVGHWTAGRRGGR